MRHGIVTKISVYEDYPTSVASKAFGANINAFAFNMDYIASKSEKLARELLLMYEQCKKLGVSHG